MRGKRDRIYSSSQEALLKIFMMILTLGISIAASILDRNSCYTTIIVQAINNIYDYIRLTNRTKYDNNIAYKSIAAVLGAIVAIIFSFVGVLGQYECMSFMQAKLLGIALIAFPIAFVFSDYRINIKRGK